MTTASDLPPLLRADSLAEQAYRAIREGIATGLFRAGERVTERGLATKLNVSATPIREALRRLEQEGLIERVSARHLRVVDHSSGTLRELLLAGAALAGICLLASMFFFSTHPHAPIWANLLVMLITIAAGAGIFFGVAYLLRVAEVHDVVDLVRRRLQPPNLS